MINSLKYLGLTDNEITLYLFLIESGDLSLSYINKSLGFGHSNTRYLCESLANKEMAFRLKRSEGAFYKALPLERVVNTLKSRSDIAKAEFMEYNLANKKIPHIMVVSSEDEVLRLYKKFWDMVPRDTTLYCHAALMPKEMSEFSDKIWLVSETKRKEKNISINVICESSSRTGELTSRDSKNQRKTIVIPNKKSLSSFEIMACDEITMEFCVKDGGYLMLMSNSPIVAGASKRRLELLWDFISENAHHSN